MPPKRASSTKSAAGGCQVEALQAGEACSDCRQGRRQRRQRQGGGRNGCGPVGGHKHEHERACSRKNIVITENITGNPQLHTDQSLVAICLGWLQWIVSEYGSVRKTSKRGAGAGFGTWQYSLRGVGLGSGVEAHANAILGQYG